MGNEGVGVVEGFLEDGVVEKGLKVGDRGALWHTQGYQALSDALHSRDGALAAECVAGREVGPILYLAHSSRLTGTWQSHTNLPYTSLIRVSSTPPISSVQAATLAINPPTALRMLSDFIPLDPTSPPNKTLSGKKQWVIQNGANSAVGTAVIQIAKSWGVGTINLVRDRYAFSLISIP